MKKAKQRTRYTYCKTCPKKTAGQYWWHGGFCPSCHTIASQVIGRQILKAIGLQL